MRRRVRVLRPTTGPVAGAVVMAVVALALGSAAPAHAAGQELTVTPRTGLVGGQVVTVTYSGYTPKAPVAVGVCTLERPVEGPGDCGRQKNGNSKLTAADASGGGTLKITIPEGPLHNLTPPATSCPPCYLGATNIADPDQHAKVRLVYASAGGSKPAAEAKPSAEAAPQPARRLAKTGPGETLRLLLAAGVLLQAGAVLVVRSGRARVRARPSA